MAEKSVKPGKKRQLKRVETVRQRAERAGTVQPRKRRLRYTAGKAGRPLVAIGRFIAKVLKPFAFVLMPFKTRPMRWLGRVLASILLLRFVREAWGELRQVQWPDVRTTIRLTTAVFVFSILFGSLVAITDYGLDKVFRKVFVD